jgi:hypothetical protein
MDDNDKVAIVNYRTGQGFTPQAPLALVAKISDAERSALESGGRAGLASHTTLLGIRYRTSIPHSYFSFRSNISTVGESVLSSLRRRF